MLSGNRSELAAKKAYFVLTLLAVLALVVLPVAANVRWGPALYGVDGAWVVGLVAIFTGPRVVVSEPVQGLLWRFALRHWGPLAPKEKE